MNQAQIETNKMGIRLSVIVPVYNGGVFLDQCLASLTKQSFQKESYEVIVVNDGSTDDSEKIIDKYCSEFGYFIKINKRNGGVSSARNLGIEKARGKYIAFVDADDLIANNAYIAVIEIMDTENLDAFYFKLTAIKEELQHNISINTLRSMCIMRASKGETSVNLAVYKYEILKEHNIRFEEKVTMGEDGLFNFFFTNATELIGATNIILYYYRFNPESSSHVLSKRIVNTYGDKEAKEYRAYESALICIEKMVKYKKTHENCRDYECDLSATILATLWSGMKYYYEPQKVLDDINASGASLSDVTIKNIEGHSFRMRLKSEIQFRFRYPIIYKGACILHKLFCKKG